MISFTVEGCAADSIKAANYIAPMNFGQTEVTPPHENENKKKPQNARKTVCASFLLLKIDHLQHKFSR